jgi:hypothetical protein
MKHARLILLLHLLFCAGCVMRSPQTIATSQDAANVIRPAGVNQIASRESAQVEFRAIAATGSAHFSHDILQVAHTDANDQVIQPSRHNAVAVSGPGRRVQHVANRVSQTDVPLESPRNSVNNRMLAPPQMQRQATTSQYWLALTPDQALALALQHANIDAIAAREKQIICQNPHPRMKQQFTSQQQLACYMIEAVARREQEMLASQVLQLYYGLAETHAQTNLVDRSEAFLSELESRLAEVKRAELKAEIDEHQLLVQQLEIQKHRAELETTEKKLTAQLSALLGCQRTPDFIWTNCQLAESPLPQDLDSAVSIAFQQRRDLSALDYLLQASDDDILAIGRVAAGEFSSAFGKLDLPIGGKLPLAFLARSFRRSGNELESCARRDQVVHLRMSLQTAIRTEVASYFHSLVGNGLQLEVQRTAIESWIAEFALRKEKRAVNKATYGEMITARSEELKAEAEFIHLAAELERQRVQFLAAQGTILHPVANCRLAEVTCNEMSFVATPLSVGHLIQVMPK